MDILPRDSQLHRSPLHSHAWSHAHAYTPLQHNTPPLAGLATNGTYRHFSLDSSGRARNTKVRPDAFDYIEDLTTTTRPLRPPNAARPDAAQKCYPRRGAGTRVFVIDTGCRATHEQLRGRVDAYPSPGSRFTSGDDDHGHGTHVAATIAGRDFGVARRARVTCIKALSAHNTGTSTDVIAAINHVIALKRAAPRAAYLMSISLGVRAPAAYDALDRAVTRAARAGIVPVVAAGNAGGEACGFTPARAAGAITVAALAGPRLASFSNRGRCVALAAPGVAVRSAFHVSDRAYARSSGTSMAAPHVSGIAALILGERPAARPRDVLREIRRGAAAVVEDIPVAEVRVSCAP